MIVAIDGGFLGRGYVGEQDGEIVLADLFGGVCTAYGRCYYQ